MSGLLDLYRVDHYHGGMSGDSVYVIAATSHDEAESLAKAKSYERAELLEENCIGGVPRIITEVSIPKQMDD